MTRSTPRWKSLPAAGYYDDPDFVERYGEMEPDDSLILMCRRLEWDHA